MIGSRLYFEIPRSQLGKEMLIVKRAVRVPVNAGYGGQEIGPRYVVKWERMNNRILLRTVSYATVADSTQPDLPGRPELQQRHHRRGVQRRGLRA